MARVVVAVKGIGLVPDKMKRSHLRQVDEYHDHPARTGTVFKHLNGRESNHGDPPASE
jgi:hypothetical protein